MNSLPHNPSPGTDQAQFEETLRLIACLPAPEGLEERVRSALQAQPKTGRVLAWPRTKALTAPRPSGQRASWMRGAAAAAIALTVLGGGWGIYSRVQPGFSGAAAAPRVGVNAGFSTAGAIRTPQTLQGPRVTPPTTPQPSTAAPGKVPAHSGPKPANKAVAGRKAAAAQRQNPSTR